MKDNIIEAISLDDLGTEPIKVTIKRPDGKRVAVKLRPLSEEEIWIIRRGIKRVKPPIKDVQKVGGVVKEIYDYDNDDYRAQVEEADRLLFNRMLLASLVLEIPGDDDEARLVYLTRTLGKYAYTQLINAVQRLNIVSAEEIADMAQSFRADGQVVTSGNGAAADTTETMAEITAS